MVAPVVDDFHHRHHVARLLVRHRRGRRRDNKLAWRHLTGRSPRIFLVHIFRRVAPVRQRRTFGDHAAVEILPAGIVDGYDQPVAIGAPLPDDLR